ncbi:sulfotransferase family 2 domain-containing protein [bacterium]|nr:sulfotransferase family 2 domain-containing protein [bacterium]
MFCFLHMEKAGGTTMHAILRNNFPTYVSLAARFSWGDRYEDYFTPRAARRMFSLIPGPAGFGGHYVAPWLDYETEIAREITYFTFLRDPIKRYRSQYEHRIYTDGLSWTSDKFMSTESYNNFMTYRLTGGQNLERAKEILDEKFSFAGMMEKYDESLLILRHLLKKPSMRLVYEKRNITKRKKEHVYDWDIDRAKENNRLDLELYDHAKKNLFDPLITVYPGDLDAETIALRQEREQGKSFSPIKDELLLSNNRYIQRKLEKWASRR